MAVNNAIKYLLFVFNLLFFIGGIAILSLYVHVSTNKANYQIVDELVPAIRMMIFIGVVTLCFGFLGCCGAILENRYYLAMFFKGLLIMFIMLLVVGVLGLISRTATGQSMVKKHVKQLLPLSKQPKDVQEAFQAVEVTGFCCGFFNGHLDWGNSTLVPNSCNCTDTARNCTTLDGREIYSTPCATYVMTWLDQTSSTLVGIAFAFGALMLVGMAFSLALHYQIGKKRKIVI